MTQHQHDTKRRILVINPNSSAVVTAAIDAAVEPLRMTGGPKISVDFLKAGPPGVVTQQDADGVVMPLVAMVRQDDADAFVIACFSDPGLHAAREAAAGRPVFGIAECGLLHALMLGDRFGVIALSPGSIKRQQRMVRQMGLYDRYAGSFAANLSPAQSTSSDMREQLAAAGRTLVSQHGADVLILGCAGMAGQRHALEEMIGRPVVEPTQQAVVAAIGRLMLMAA
jgi:allantoin racemase